MTNSFCDCWCAHLGSSGEQAVERLEKAKSYSNCLIVDRRIDFQDVEKYFSAADIIALPYLEGTTSGVLKLALAFGKPVVATNVGDFQSKYPMVQAFLLSQIDSIVICRKR